MLSAWHNRCQQSLQTLVEFSVAELAVVDAYLWVNYVDLFCYVILDITVNRTVCSLDIIWSKRHDDRARESVFATIYTVPGLYHSHICTFQSGCCAWTSLHLWEPDVRPCTEIVRLLFTKDNLWLGPSQHPNSELRQ